MNRLHPLSRLLLVLLLPACSGKEEESAASDCGPNGDWVDEHGHCHCDSGYTLTADGNDCVAKEGGDDDSWSGDDVTDPDDGDTGEPESSFQPESVEASLFVGEPPAWVLVAKEGSTWLSIENYPSYGGASGPETRTIGADDANYATCGICILVQTGCEPHGDHSHCETTFMAEAGGEVRFDELGTSPGESWAGRLSGLRFVEVEINSSYESTPVDGGESLDLSYWSFDAVLEAG